MEEEFVRCEGFECPLQKIAIQKASSVSRSFEVPALIVDPCFDCCLENYVILRICHLFWYKTREVKTV
jgi:hypothetical protein